MYFVRIGYFLSILLYYVNGFCFFKIFKKMRNLIVRVFYVNVYLYQLNVFFSFKNLSIEFNLVFKKWYCKCLQGYYWNKIKFERIYFKIWCQLIRWILID